VRVTISGDDLAQVMGGSAVARRIELKVTFPVAGQCANIEGIGHDPLEAQPRHALYFDTPDLALNRAGLVVRALRIQGGRAETVVKLLSVAPSVIEAQLSGSDALVVEADSTPEGFVCAISVKGRCSGRDVQDVAAGAAPLRTLLSPEQCAYYDARAPAGITLESLTTLGPVLLFRTKRRSKVLDRRLVVEEWLHPDGAHVLELSTKCTLDECSQVSAQLRALLASHGLTASSDQATRTNAELDLLSAALR